jgi:class 3 adenylate cyclase/TolB-like protein
MERKLAAILAADIVGYSAQMERDEAGTFTRLTERRKGIFEPEIARHGGRIFKTMGDGILAEAGSVVQAVECAVALQAALDERNRDGPEDQAIRARIGINLGEVIVDGGDRYGEGVNIAARLEQLAEPGGICVSDKVAREVEKRLAFGFVPMGAQRVKNIAEPVMAYRVTSSGRPVRRTPPAPARNGIAGRPQAIGLAAVLILAVALSVWWLWPTARSGPPTLAVLPFVNLSGDPSQDYLGVAVAEDIMMLLATSPMVQVVSRGTGASAAAAEDVRSYADRLGIAYLLEGSLRRQGDTFIISTQLTDPRTGLNLWSDRLEQHGGDLIALQEAIAQKVFATLATTTGEIGQIEAGLSFAKPKRSLEEYDYHLRAVAAYLKFDGHSRSEAERILVEGLEKFPDSALLRLELAAVYDDYAQEGPSSDPWKDIQTAWRLVNEAAAKPGKSRMEEWLTHQMTAQIMPLATGDFAGSVRAAEAAHAMAPNDTLSNLALAVVMANAGEGARAVELAENAVRNAPDVPGWYRDKLAWAYWSAGRFEEAIIQYEQTDHYRVPCKVSTLVRLGRLDEAQALMAEDQLRRPGWAVEDERLWPTGRHPMMIDRLIDPYMADLRTAGGH